MRIVTVRLPNALHAKLTAAARQLKTTKSVVVRGALEDYLDTAKAGKSGSVLDLAGDLVGSLEGPGDLSYNKEHMRGYGT